MTPDNPTVKAPPVRHRCQCPYCGKVNPLFDVNFSGGHVPGMGHISTVTFSCEACGKILSVGLAGFQPDADFIERKREQITASALANSVPAKVRPS